MSLPPHPWHTHYPTSQDSPLTEQPDLINESAPGADDGDIVLVEHVETLRDKLQAVALAVGDSVLQPGGCILGRLDAIETDLGTAQGDINDLQDAAVWTERVGPVQTTDATETTLWSKVLADITAYWFEAWVVARVTDGSADVAFKLIVQAHREGAGAVIGTVLLEYKDPLASLWFVDFDTDGNSVRLRVIGAAAKQINWVGTVAFHSVSLLPV